MVSDPDPDSAPGSQTNADPDLALWSQTDADPDPDFAVTNVEFLLEHILYVGNMS